MSIIKKIRSHFWNKHWNLKEKNNWDFKINIETNNKTNKAQLYHILEGIIGSGQLNFRAEDSLEGYDKKLTLKITIPIKEIM